MRKQHSPSSSGQEAKARHRGNDYKGRLKAAALLPIIIILMIFIPRWFGPDDE